MSGKLVTVEEIIESSKVNGKDGVLVWDPAVFRDNKAKNKNAKYDCTWVPIKFKYATGETAPVRVKFSKVATSSAAKIPQSSEEVKHLVINFREVTELELNAGDLAPKNKGSDEEQKKENERAHTEIASVNKATNDFVSALEIIDLSYKKICSDMKKNHLKLKFSIKKEKNIKDVKMITEYSIRQTEREDKDNPNNMIKLEKPLTRIKLLIDPKTGRVGIDKWGSTKGTREFSPNVYNARKMKASNNYEPVLATVKKNNKIVPLDKDNASEFITYRSIVSGTVEFPEIIISKNGFSLKNQFDMLFVKRNKSGLEEVKFSKEDLGICGDEETDDDDVEIKTEQVTHQFKKMDVTNVNDDNSDLEDYVDNADIEQNSDLEDDCENDSDV